MRLLASPLHAALLTLATLVTLTAHAQSAPPSTFDKHYPIATKARLEVNLGNASVETRSCGSCRAIHIHLEMNGQDTSRFEFTEVQSGDSVRFTLKQREDFHFGGWNGSKQPELTVELPTQSDATLHTGNGAMKLDGITGALSLSTGNGSINTDHTAGSLHLSTGNGAITAHEIDGALEAHTGNGSVHADGRFNKLDAHSGNGGVELAIHAGSVLDSGSRVTTGSGSVTLRVTRDLHAELHLHTGSGGIHSDLPLLVTNLGDNRFTLDGTLNGGGGTLRVETGSGSIHLSAL